MKSIYLFLIVILMCLISCSSGNYLKNYGVYIQSINLFESEYKSPKKVHKYNQYFNQSEARYINWKIDFYHPSTAYNSKFVIDAKYSTKDSIIFKENTLDVDINKNWESSSYILGVGWDVPKNWFPDKYFITYYIDGNKIGRSDFEIINDLNYKYLEHIDSYLVDIKFFERGFDSIEPENRIYINEFQKYLTRYINYEITLLHPFLPGERNFNIKSIYYKANNEVFSEIVDNFQYKNETTIYWTSNGCGWEKPNQWEKGEYRVEFFIEDVKIGEEKFTIL